MSFSELELSFNQLLTSAASPSDGEAGQRIARFMNIWVAQAVRHYWKLAHDGVPGFDKANVPARLPAKDTEATRRALHRWYWDTIIPSLRRWDALLLDRAGVE